MEAKVHHELDHVVVDLKGFINIETAHPFREACLKSLAPMNKRVVFNLEELNFVGSNGLLPFIETLQDLRSKGQIEMQFVKVSSEFQKLFSASPLNDIEILDKEPEENPEEDPEASEEAS